MITRVTDQVTVTPGTKIRRTTDFGAMIPTGESIDAGALGFVIEDLRSGGQRPDMVFGAEAASGGSVTYGIQNAQAGERYLGRLEIGLTPSGEVIPHTFLIKTISATNTV